MSPDEGTPLILPINRAAFRFTARGGLFFLIDSTTHAAGAPVEPPGVK